MRMESDVEKVLEWSISAQKRFSKQIQQEQLEENKTYEEETVLAMHMAGLMILEELQKFIEALKKET